MSGKVESTLMFMVAGVFSVGILGNAFIGLVNCVDWIKNRKIISIDLILTSLALSRIGLLCILLLDCFILVLYPDVYTTSKQMIIIDFFWTLTNHLSISYATCLSVFYFLKIAHFSHPLFLWMKWRIDKVTLRILLGCLALSMFVSLPVTQNFNDDFRLCVKARWKRNLTLKCRDNKAQYASTKILLNLFTLFPFSVSLISFLLLILSLWRHTRQLQLSATGYRDPSTAAHVGAMKALVSFLLLFFVYYLAFLVATSSYFMPETEIAVILGELIALIYPTSHSYILILGNNKLRLASQRVLRKVKYILQTRKF
ncbi:taste receptor type 2 member 7-like [Choloepus didactylus]|uniref:taste receptor type 2 member 7-like n=1 Tax=Choloepus didactylus TaxID=27675 RepID=UPI00189F3B8D|nr:taste receptor type 2 member 7-like [Choloepus didactylus]